MCDQQQGVKSVNSSPSRIRPTSFRATCTSSHSHARNRKASTAPPRISPGLPFLVSRPSFPIVDQQQRGKTFPYNNPDEIGLSLRFDSHVYQ